MRLRSDAKLRKKEFQSSYGFPIRKRFSAGFSACDGLERVQLHLEYMP